MSLRLRLALALALLAAVSVIAVATTSYLQTSDRLHEELDNQLRADVQPILPANDPSGFIAPQLCASLADDDSAIGGYAARIANQLGNSLQCYDSNGVTGETGRARLPVTKADLRLDVDPPALVTRQRNGHEYRTITIGTGEDAGYIRIIRDLQPTKDVLASIRERSALIGLAAIVVAALAGWLIASAAARPMRRLTTAAEQVAATGELDHPVPVTGSGEVGRLARAFTSMLRALAESRAQQQRLVQDASHELRTPLTSLRTNIDTLRRHSDLDPEVRDRVLADLDNELQELGNLTTELVQLTVDAHATELEVPIELDQLVGRVVTRAKRRTGREINLTSSPTMVLARPEGLARAVTNLLDNAQKFSPDDTPIEVTVQAGCIEVHDGGPGIDPSDLPHVFDRFYRSVDARGLPGSGLGLSIVRAVVEASGGRVYAANHPDGGATLTIVLPTVAATGDAAQPEKLPADA